MSRQSFAIEKNVRFTSETDVFFNRSTLKAHEVARNPKDKLKRSLWPVPDEIDYANKSLIFLPQK